MTRSGLRLAGLIAMCLSIPVSARAATENYSINLSSFTQEFGSTSPQRVIEFAAHQWAAAGGQDTLTFDGNNVSDTGCGFGNVNHIFMTSGCMEPECTTLADFFDCPFGGWRVRVWAGAATFALGNPAPTSIDLQSVIQHELGHRTRDHDDSLPLCVMNSGIGLGDTSQRFFCRNELSSFSTTSFTMTRVRTSISDFPELGNSANWSSTSLGTIRALGGAAIQRGLASNNAVMDRLIHSDFVNSPNAMNVTNYSASPLSSVAINSYLTRQRPSMAYDWTRRKWWACWRADSSTTPDGYDCSVSSDGSTWSTFTPLAHGTSRIGSRVPLGMTYDTISDRIIVVYVDWAAGFNNPGTLRFVTHAASSNPTSSGTWSSPTTLTGETSVSAPAVACEDSTTTYQCQVMIVGTDAFRHIWQFRFGMNSSGVYTGKTSATDTGGWTDAPPSLSWNGENEAGMFVATHAGLDAQLYTSQKRFASDTWPSWTGRPISVNRVAPQAIMIREASGNYDIIVQQ